MHAAALHHHVLLSLHLLLHHLTDEAAHIDWSIAFDLDRRESVALVERFLGMMALSISCFLSVAVLVVKDIIIETKCG